MQRRERLVRTHHLCRARGRLRRGGRRGAPAPPRSGGHRLGSAGRAVWRVPAGARGVRTRNGGDGDRVAAADGLAPPRSASRRVHRRGAAVRCVAWWVGGLALAVLAGCQERLTQPGECPELCPGGTPEVIEEILVATPGLDSAFSGYADRGSAQVLLVSRGVPAAPDTNIAVVVFAPRPTEVQFAGSARSYTVDSIRLGVGLIARDTAVNNLRFEVYRLPPTLDTTALTYVGVRG